MIELHTEFLSYIGEATLTVDDLHTHIHNFLGDRYEIGDAGIVINDMLSLGLIDVDYSKIINRWAFRNACPKRDLITS